MDIYTRKLKNTCLLYVHVYGLAFITKLVLWWMVYLEIKIDCGGGAGGGGRGRGGESSVLMEVKKDFTMCNSNFLGN